MEIADILVLKYETEQKISKLLLELETKSGMISKTTINQECNIDHYNINVTINLTL